MVFLFSFCEVYKNIEKGNLSNAMYHEIRSIEQLALKRGISLDYPHDKVQK
jgi:hypothetical protein